MVKYLPTDLKKKKGQRRTLSNDAYVLLFFLLFFLSQIFFISAFVVGTHSNCICRLTLFKWVHTKYTLIKK